jgi:hypothetical protein
MDIALLKLMLMKHSIHHLWKFCENWRMGFGGGNPYNLTSTVTAGIVSAKARDQQAEFNLYSNRRSGKPRKQRRRSGKSRGIYRNQHYDFLYDRFLCWVFFLYRLI